jgi:hypothetical protein
LAKPVDVIDGEILWSRIREYMPKTVLWDNLDKARKMLNEAGDDYDFTLQMSRESTAILVSPRSEESEPVKGSLNLQFPDTLEGLAKKTEFLNHLRTGEPVLITKESADKIEINMPEIFRNLSPEGEITHLYVRPARVDPPMIRQLLVEGREGTQCSFEYIDFTDQQGGTDEVTFSNRRQPIPFKFSHKIIKLQATEIFLSSSS